MRQFIESLKRLFVSGKISEKKINDLQNDGKINEEERSYILDAR